MLAWGLAVLAVGDILVVIGQEEGCQRQGDDEADKAEERAPDREREQDDGGIETHGLAHDLGGKEEVLDALHDDINGHARPPYRPEVDVGVGAVDEAEDGRRHDGDELEIGHHVEQADEEAEDDGEGQADDDEADAEEDADAEGDESLTAEVVVHAVFDVVADAVGARAVFWGHHALEAAKQALVVEHDEDDVEDDDKPVEDAEDKVEATADEAHGEVEEVLDVLARHLLGYRLEVDGAAEVVVEGLGDEGNLTGGLGVAPDKLGHLVHLVDDGGNEEDTDDDDDENRLEEGHENGQQARAHAEEAAVILHEGLEHVGYEPRDAEGQQHRLEDVNEPDGAEERGDGDEQADDAVEGKRAREGAAGAVGLAIGPGNSAIQFILHCGFMFLVSFCFQS